MTDRIEEYVMHEELIVLTAARLDTENYRPVISLSHVVCTRGFATTPRPSASRSTWLLTRAQR